MRWHLGRCVAGDATPVSGQVSSVRKPSSPQLRPAGPGHLANRLGPPYSAASGVQSTCHFLPLRSNTSPFTRPEAWAGHGLWRPCLVSHWALGRGRREEAGAPGAGFVTAPLGSTMGISGHNSTSALARASTWASVLSHMARQWEAGRFSSTEDLTKGCPPSSPLQHLAGFGAKRSLFPCSTKGLIRPQGWGTADGSLKAAMQPAKAVSWPCRPSHCVPALHGLPDPHLPGVVLGGPLPLTGRGHGVVSPCNTFECSRPPPLSARGRCHCASGSWPLS